MAVFVSPWWFHKRDSLPLLVCVWLTLSIPVAAQLVGVNSYLDGVNVAGPVDVNDVDGLQESLNGVPSEGASSMEGWGVPDQVAVAGRLFKCHMPEDLIQDGESFKIAEVTTGQLPDWMTFDGITSQLLGVPKSDHVGKQHYLEVLSTASNRNNESGVSQSRDMFALSVVEDKVHYDTETRDAAQTTSTERIKCPSGSSVTRASVTVDVDMNELLPKEMVEMMEKLGKHLNMPAELLRMVPAGGPNPVVDRSALVAGPGDKELKTSGTFLQWEVGCGNVEGYHMPILQHLEAASADGRLSKAIGKGVVSWHVVNNRPQTLSRLKRRAPSNPEQRGRRRNRGEDNEFDNEEGSGFWTETPPIVDKPKSSPTIRPTKTRKPHRTKTRKPRPSKSKGRHYDRTKHPKHTVPMVSPTKTSSQVMPTVVYTTIPQLHLTPEVSSTVVATPSLPEEIVTKTMGITTRPADPTQKGRGPSTTSGLLPIATDTTDQEPRVLNEIKRLEVRVGDILEYQVPALTFIDSEDGNTRNLELVMLTLDRFTLLNSSWVQFNPKTQTIFGIPMKKHVGTYEYQMFAMDRRRQMARDPFKIKVVDRPGRQAVSHEFSVKLNLNYDRFVNDVSQRMDVTQKLAGVYGDKDLSKITVTNIAKGSVEYSWTNNSLPLDSCPVSEINRLLSFILVDKALNPKFLKGMEPYEVQGAGVAPKGPCKDKVTTPIGAVFETTTKKATSDDTVKSSDDDGAMASRPTSDDDQFITTIVPVVVITTMLLVAAIIVCCLYRRKHKGKMSDEDNSTFVSKGIPVIFADELEDKPDPPSKPLIMSEEKPLLPPPEYPRSNSGGSLPSTPGSCHREPLLEEDGRYTRPPPVNGSMGRRLPKTPNTSYRQPPPYTSIPP